MGAGLYYLLYNNKTAPITEETVYKDLIKVASPRANDLVTSPLLIKGEARGNWYFEASFPVKLFDANGEIVPLEPGYIMARGDPATGEVNWMTTEYVPFEATLTFQEPATATGLLVLEKDNASGLPEFDDQISIPVRFSQ